MLDFQDEQPTQPIPFETLAEVARKWREELNREKLAASNEKEEARTQRIKPIR